MSVQVYRYPHDVPLEHAMLVWTRGEKVGVVPHPDKRGLSDGFRSSVGACFAEWGALDDRGRRLQLLIDAWHTSVFYDIPSEAIHQALLCIPEYRDMLADDCLPKEFRHERD
jgi:hypothetical protein